MNCLVISLLVFSCVFAMMNAAPADMSMPSLTNLIEPVDTTIASELNTTAPENMNMTSSSNATAPEPMIMTSVLNTTAPADMNITSWVNATGPQNMNMTSWLNTTSPANINVTYYPFQLPENFSVVNLPSTMKVYFDVTANGKLKISGTGVEDILEEDDSV